ncbi:hypothetical protein Tco_1140506 [Tanacetum coccineum]
MAEGEIDDLTTKQYLTLTLGNQASGVVKPEIGGNVNFGIKSQFMRELREETFSRNKNDDAHEHVEQVLDIVGLFNIPGVTHDTVMLGVFPITFTRASKSTMNHQLLDSQGPILGMTPAQALMAIQTMADHSQKWYDGSSSRSINNNNRTLKESLLLFAKEPILTRSPPGYYTRIDNRPPFKEKKSTLEELMNKHLEESTQRRAEMEEWIEQLTKEFHAKTVSEVNNSSFDQCKAVYDDKEPPLNNEINEPHEVSFVFADRTYQEKGVSSKILSCQQPPKELNPGNFTLPCTIGSLNFYAMADLGASINVIPISIFEHLKLSNLKETDMTVVMADMTEKTPLGIIENVLVKIDKFLFSQRLHNYGHDRGT